MAIGTYTELKNAVENWLAHQLFTARVPEFIALFEAAANRRLRVRQQETTTTLTPSVGSATLPTDYLQFRRVTWAGSPTVQLEYVAPDYFYAAYATASSGIPSLFTIEGSNFLLNTSDTTGVTFAYYQKIAALSDTATTNWLLTAHPDVYLFGSLIEATLFGVDDDRAPIWKARRDELFDEIERLSNKSRGSGGMRVLGATP